MKPLPIAVVYSFLPAVPSECRHSARSVENLEWFTGWSRCVKHLCSTVFNDELKTCGFPGACIVSALVMHIVRSKILHSAEVTPVDMDSWWIFYNACRHGKLILFHLWTKSGWMFLPASSLFANLLVASGQITETVLILSEHISQNTKLFFQASTYI